MSRIPASLVQYSDSETDEDVNEEVGKGRKAEPILQSEGESSERKLQSKRKRLTVPDDIVEMFGDETSTKNAKGDNLGGKVRTFPHEEGDWPSFVYIPVKVSENLQALLNALVKKANEMLPGIESISIKDLHISLSRTVSLRHYWIEVIVAKLKESFYGMQSFIYHLDLLEVYTNDDRTRSFIGFRIMIGEEQLKRLSKKVDGVLEEFGLPTYYENPIFHISFAWYLGDITSMLPENFLQDLQLFADSFGDDAVDRSSNSRIISNDIILLKTGKKVFNFCT